MKNGKKDTTKKDSEELIEKALDNLAEDRQKLVELYGKVESVIDSDPLTAIGVMEPLTKLVDALTKQNVQIIELAKLKMKKSPSPAGELDSDDTEDIYSQIKNAENYQ